MSNLKITLSIWELSIRNTAGLTQGIFTLASVRRCSLTL